MSDSASLLKRRPTGTTASGAMPMGLMWLASPGPIFGAMLFVCGVALFVSADSAMLSPSAHFFVVLAMVAACHLAGGLARRSFESISTALHAVGTTLTGAAIVFVGRIFQVPISWPGTMLLWLLAALAGWVLLRDQAQQALTFVLLPAWIYFSLLDQMSGHIGAPIYLGRFQFVWAILYLTFFAHSKRKAVQAILIAASAPAILMSVPQMLNGWSSYRVDEGFVPYGARMLAWTAIAAVPLMVAAFHGHKGLAPIAVAIGFVIALPWCYSTRTEYWSYRGGASIPHTVTQPNLLAYMLVAAFAAFLCGWGVRLVSRALVNLSVVFFSLALSWFYFSIIFSDKHRAAGFLGFGVLVLAFGWGLATLRRRVLARMTATLPQAAPETGGAQ